MLPLVGIPRTIEKGLEGYREVFKRESEYRHVSRYVSGLLLSENKTLQGMHSQYVFKEGEQVSRRTMHEAVMGGKWEREKLMKQHREEVGKKHRGKGKEVIAIDWTLAHHEQGKKIYGVKRMYDYVEKKMSRYQTVMTAVVSNRGRIDGISTEVQTPSYEKEEKLYLQMSTKQSYEEMSEVKERLLELLHYQKNRLAYRKRTEMAVEMVEQIEAEGNFPNANYAFDNGVLSRPLTELIEGKGKHWVSEIECSRHIRWQDQWQRVDKVEQYLRTNHPESFRKRQVTTPQGETRFYWTFTKTVRLKKYGRKRLVIVHEQEDLQDTPRYLLSDALTWESGRIIQTWHYRWPVEVFHEFVKQVAGFESAHFRNQEAVKRHFCLSCVAQSLLQQVPPAHGSSDRFDFSDNQITLGQRLLGLARESLASLLHLAHSLFDQGRSVDSVLEVLIPV